MFLSLISFCLLLTITTSITPVPGTIHIRLLSDNQISTGVYQPSSIVRYTIDFENVPIDDNIYTGVEIRGSNPIGGPRGYITMAHDIVSIGKFLEERNNPFAFELIPNEIYAGYNWFLRPFMFYSNESLISTNMMNSGASDMFTVLKQ